MDDFLKDSKNKRLYDSIKKKGSGLMVLDLLYRDEAICLFCKDVKEKKISYLCKDCFSLLNFKSEFFDIEYYNGVYSVLEYDRFLKPHLHSYKYENSSYYYKLFGEILAYEIESKDLFKSIDYLIPVPLHRSRKAFRGFNQSELLGEYLEKKLGIKILRNLLIKNKKTKDQHNLNENDRKKNLRDVFHIKDGSLIRDRNILVIDDILTTGTTLKNCGEILKKQGPKEIYGLTLATGR